VLYLHGDGAHAEIDRRIGTERQLLLEAYGVAEFQLPELSVRRRYQQEKSLLISNFIGCRLGLERSNRSVGKRHLGASCLGLFKRPPKRPPDFAQRERKLADAGDQSSV
jgi:hypothetical protein